MSISHDMRRTVRSLLKHYEVGHIPPGFMNAFRDNFLSLADQVESLEATVVPQHARALGAEELPSNVVPFAKRPCARRRTIDGGAA